VGPRPLDPDEPGHIGGYRLLSVLGEGGQGVVYRGEAADGTAVAVKVLRRDAAGDDAQRRRFLREVAAARRVAAFCTAHVLDLGEHHGRPYVVSEYIPGPSLAAAVAADGPRTGSGLHRLAVTTLTALAAIHDAGVVHRDFKPANVILGPEGPVVIDFGIARTDGHLATTGSGVLGTPAYLAPEQLAGRPPDPASDLFGWACTMVFAATGRLAFPGDTVPAVLMAIAAREPDLSGVPDALRPFLAACLAKDPAARPTAAALLRELTALRSPGHGDATATPGVAGHGGAPGAPPDRPSFGGSAATLPDASTGRHSPEHGGTSPSAAFRPDGGSAVTPGTVPGASAGFADTASARTPVLGEGGHGATGRSRRVWLVAGASLVALLAIGGIALALLPRLAQDPPEGSARQAPVNGTLLYEDDFTERGGWDGYTFAPDAPGDQRTVRGHEIERGVFTMYADREYASNTALSPMPEKAENADGRDVRVGVTAEIRDVSARQGGIGLLCRWDEEVPNGYAFRLGLDGAVRVSRTDQGARRPVGAAARVAAPAAGGKVRLQAACRSAEGGTRLTFWVDGVQVLDVVDDRAGPSGGINQVGLNVAVAESDAGSLTVSFDDFTVHRLG